MEDLLPSHAGVQEHMEMEGMWLQGHFGGGPVTGDGAEPLPLEHARGAEQSSD
jgi:hypothetical protein